MADAFARISGKHDVQLVLAGPDNGALAGVLERAGRSGLASRVKYAGTVLGEKKYRLIAGSEFVAYPPMKELQGLVLLEAMAQAKAVITSGLDNGLPDYMRSGDNGLQVKFGDVVALARNMSLLLEDPQTRKRIGESGKKTAERFRWNKIIDRTEEIYKEAVKK